MDTLAIFGLQLVLSLVVWGLLAKWLLAPWLEKQPLYQALFWLTLPHVSRHVGMVFLVPGIVDQPLPDSFAVPAAYGDLISALLALVTLIALRTGQTKALVLVWIFNIVGTVDLLYALSHADAVPVEAMEAPARRSFDSAHDLASGVAHHQQHLRLRSAGFAAQSLEIR